MIPFLASLFALVAFWAACTSGEINIVVLFESSEGWKTLTRTQQLCSTDSAWGGVVPRTNCKIKECVCGNPQMISDIVDKCLSEMQAGVGNPGAFNIDNYNAVMHFFGGECGFEVQQKVSKPSLMSHPCFAVGEPHQEQEIAKWLISGSHNSECFLYPDLFLTCPDRRPNKGQLR
jgi:hypothetical protein